ncbi:transposase [Butyrivibrio sp. DSM 10294]|uniref:transposase n=1 Tax=Butyrivibrio sp. DSM 10294 TaxID=2972457 RepID=UPI00234F4545|nr:transposase [Butyrivibrio sp. DSM 10294]MDC7292999.1 transposase [Butyrivibrio sp. DSM 10294]
MSRELKVWYPGAIYHVMSRGNHKNDIYIDSEDYIMFLKILSFMKKRYNFKVHSLCLMTNHFHLLIETTDVSISRIMQHLLSNYSHYYNDAHDFEGHVFQGRYYSKIINDDNYLLEAIRYIHRNPVKASIVSKAEKYPYTSYREFLKTEYELTFPGSILERLLNEITDLNRVKEYFGENKEKYRKFNEDRISHQDAEAQIQLDMKEDERGIPLYLMRRTKVTGTLEE